MRNSYLAAAAAASAHLFTSSQLSEFLRSSSSTSAGTGGNGSARRLSLTCDRDEGL